MPSPSPSEPRAEIKRLGDWLRIIWGEAVMFVRIEEIAGIAPNDGQSVLSLRGSTTKSYIPLPPQEVWDALNET